MESRVNATGQQAADLGIAASPAALRDLEEAIRAVEPRALMVRPRILRRVIADHYELVGLALRLPHRKSCVIGREALLAIVDPDELGLDSAEAVPERAILLPQPSEARLVHTSAADLLLYYWRLLFHARIHVEIEQRAAEGRLTAEAVADRIRCIGGAEFDEIRTVLVQEAFLLSSADDFRAYAEFVAVYWELRFFSRHLLPRYFPGIEDFRRIEAILAQDVDATRCLEATRLAGLSDEAWKASSRGEASAASLAAADAAALAPLARAADRVAYRRLVRRAQEAAGRGNLVRSAILRARAEQAAPPELAAKAQGALKRDVDRMARRLQVALEIEDEDPQPWQEVLLALARQTPRGAWTAEARLLYDLQKACLAHERKAYRIDVARWIASLGREPIQRPLPAQRDVALAKRLRSAARRTPAVALPEAMRQKLTSLLETATHHAEQRLRTRFRPLVSRALDEAGLRPANVVERVAWKKVVEELLDRIVESGHLTMGDLRDAISRNNLKLADFSWTADGLHGDPLLRADQRLSRSLDGVHRRGEFYLRWMQRLSSLAFGTRLGRFVTRFLAIPFGGTFLVVSFLDHVVEKIVPLFTGASVIGPSAAWSAARVLVLGTFVLGLVNVDWFRRGAWRVLVGACRKLRDGVLGVVGWLRQIEWLAQLLKSRAVRLAHRFVVKPLVFTSLAWLALPMQSVGQAHAVGAGAALFAAFNVFLNSRLGRDVEELLADAMMQAWRRLGFPILTGLFYFVVDLFRGIVEAAERLIYTVDEWLQFRTGETRLKFVAKAVVVPLWLLAAYVLRFCINLLIEPQINPIKHFPVVTVSHKLLLPFIPAFGALLSQTLEKELAYTVAGLIITGIPGIFGFLVWELKENWRLYAANRPRGVPRAVVGHHGESMGRLFRPGIHSGTVPKLFAKLRRAARRTPPGTDGRAVLLRLRAIRRVQRAIREFVERELVELLGHAPRWRNVQVRVAAIHVSTNRARIVLERSTGGAMPLEIAFEMRSGWLVARLARVGFADELEPTERMVFETALAGLCQMAGVELLDEQLRLLLPKAAGWTFTGEGLAVDFQNGVRTRAFYRFGPDGPLVPRLPPNGPPVAAPELDPHQVFFGRSAIAWEAWVGFWEQARREEGSAPRPILSIRVLPEIAR